MPVPQIDFGPLGDLYNTYRQGQAQSALQNFGETLQAPGQTNYQSLAALAAQAGKPELAISLLQQADNRAAGQTLATMFGSQTPQQSAAAPSNPAVAAANDRATSLLQQAPPSGSMPLAAPAQPVTSPRPGGPIPSSPTVWGDKEAEAAGLYDRSGQPAPPPAAPVQVAQAGPSAPAAAPMPTPAQSGIRTPGTGLRVIDAPATQGMPENVKKALPVLLSSPQYASIGLAMLQKYINPEQFSLEVDGVGNVFSRSNQTGERKAVVTATPAASNAAASGLPTPLAYETSLENAKVDAENRKLTEAQRNAGINNPAAQPATASGVNPVIDYQAATERAKEVAKAQGETIGEVVKSARPAGQRIQQLSIIGDALERGGGNITTGPFAETVLRGKEAIGGLFGIDLKGTPEAEVAQKTGLGLAIQTVKELTSRGTQFELRSAIANNPGLLLSQTGSRAMINILTQTARQDIDLAKLAQNPANHANWQDVQDNYYKTHPLMSPFDPSKPLGTNDLKQLQAGAQGQQSDLASRATATATNPKTGQKAYYVDGKWTQ